MGEVGRLSSLTTLRLETTNDELVKTLNKCVDLMNCKNSETSGG